MPRSLTFWTEPPTHIRVYPCPQCQETISVNAPSCRFCHVPVDLKVAEQLWAENRQNATAITTATMRANMFSFTTHAAMAITGITLWILYFYGSLRESSVIFSLLAISYGAQWLNHNSSLITDDADYLKAVAKVKKTMLVWVAAVLMQVAAYLLLNGVPDWNTILDLLLVE